MLAPRLALAVKLHSKALLAARDHAFSLVLAYTFLIGRAGRTAATTAGLGLKHELPVPLCAGLSLACFIAAIGAKQKEIVAY